MEDQNNIINSLIKRGSFFNSNLIDKKSDDIRKEYSKNNVHALMGRATIEDGCTKRARQVKCRDEEISPGELAKRSLPKQYTPPDVRFLIGGKNNKGNVEMYNDLNDSIAEPSFSRIDKNISLKDKSDKTLLKFSCKCEDECRSGRCLCRKNTSHNVKLLNDGRIEVKEKNFEMRDGRKRKGESSYLNYHIFVCGNSCSCDPLACRNRINWEENEGDFEIVRRDSRMGFELRCLRSFLQGEIVIEFNGVCEKNLTDDDKLEYSFLIFDEKDECKSEDKFGKDIWEEELEMGRIFLNPMTHGSIARFISHSRMMNVHPLRVYASGSHLGQPRLFFVAALTIPYGEFLKVNYGDEYNAWLLQPGWNHSEKKYKSKGCACDEILCHNTKVLAVVGKNDKLFALRLLNARELENRKRMWTMEMQAFGSIVDNESILLRNITNQSEHEKVKKIMSKLVKYYKENEEELRKEMAKDEATEEWQREMGEESNDENDDIEEKERMEEKRKREEKIEKEEQEGIENVEEWGEKTEEMRKKINRKRENNKVDDDGKEWKRLKARKTILKERKNEENNKRRNQAVECIEID